jgi:WD repeat-containing protein 35
MSIFAFVFYVRKFLFCPVPVLIDTGMTAACCRWNHNGSVIAVTGVMQLAGDNKDCNVIQFFTAFGEVLSVLLL